MAGEYQIIESPGALQELCRGLGDEPCLAVDTEFVWERTYYARLGLVQLAVAGGRSFLVDAVAIADLAPLGPLIAEPRIVKILHDAPQDLMILRRATGASAHNVFDTRLAAGFAGLSCETSLQNLLADLLGVQLPKGHTRTDWTARPLSRGQLDYAAADVTDLPRAAALLRERAREAGVDAWLDQELRLLDNSILFEERAPEDAYRRIRGGEGLRPRSLAVLKEVAAWREKAASAADIPRRRVAEDFELMAVARLMPRSQAELGACRGLAAGTVQRHGDALLASVERGLAVPEAGLESPAPPPDARRLGPERITAVAETIRKLAEARRVDWRLVGAKNDIMQLLQAGAAARPEDHRLLRGWRRELLGESLAGILGGPAPAAGG